MNKDKTTIEKSHVNGSGEVTLNYKGMQGSFLFKINTIACLDDLQIIQ